MQEDKSVNLTSAPLTAGEDAECASDYDALTQLRKNAAELREDLARVEDRIRRLEHARWREYQRQRDAALRSLP